MDVFWDLISVTLDAQRFAVEQAMLNITLKKELKGAIQAYEKAANDLEELEESYERMRAAGQKARTATMSINAIVNDYDPSRPIGCIAVTSCNCLICRLKRVLSRAITPEGKLL